MTLDQVPSNRWKGVERTGSRNVALRRYAGTEVAQKLRPRMLPGTQEDAIGMLRSLFGHGGDMQPAQSHKAATPPVVVGDLIGPVS